MKTHLTHFLYVLFSVMAGSYGYDLQAQCKNLEIYGADQVCSYSVGKTIHEYELNYDRVQCVNWFVTGGYIASIDGKLIDSYYQNYLSVDVDGVHPAQSGHVYGCGDSDYPDLEVEVGVNSQELELSAVGLTELIEYIFTGTDNPFKKIGIVWTNPNGGSISVHGLSLGVLGYCGDKHGSKNVSVIPPFPAIGNLNLSGNNISCGSGTQVSMSTPYIGGASYTWNTPGSNVGSNWNTGIYINNFSSAGSIPVSVTVSNQCQSITKSINITTLALDPGLISSGTLAGNVAYVNAQCNGTFQLQMNNWISSQALYTWELPDSYNPQTGTFSITKKSGSDLRTVTGLMPAGAIKDYHGKVTISNFCGGPVVVEFVIQALSLPYIPPTVQSCTSPAVIQTNIPSTSSCNWYVNGSSNNGGPWGGTFSSPAGCGGDVYFSAVPGYYNVVANISSSSGCFTTLYSTITIGSGPGTNGTNGFKAGVLSDIRIRPGSNILGDNANSVYFAGRDGKLYHYYYSTTLTKWISEQIGSLSDIKIPAAGSFTPIVSKKINPSDNFQDYYLFYVNANNHLAGYNLLYNFSGEFSTLTVDTKNIAVDGITSTLYYRDASGHLCGDQYATSALMDKSNIAAYNGKVFYVYNNNLYTWQGGGSGTQVSSETLLANTNLSIQGNYIYYSTAAGLYRRNISALSSPAETVVSNSNLSGIFGINSVTGTVYYGVKVGTLTTNNPADGSYTNNDIYEAYLNNGSWTTIKASTGSNEGYDQLLGSIVIAGNHPFYIGSGKNSISGNSYSLEVWNLYPPDGCYSPAVLKSAMDESSAENIPEELLNVYPNPFEHTLQIRSLSADRLSVEVLDAAGRLVMKTTDSGQVLTLNTTDWASGLYIVKVYSGDVFLGTKKVIK